MTPTPYKMEKKRGELMNKLKVRDALVKKEKNRLKRLFKDVPQNKLKTVDGLIIQAARLRVLLDEMWIDISEKGDYEMFSQSENQIPYERERPVAKNYNNRVQIYQRIIKQLTDYLPEEKREETGALVDGSDLL